LPPSLYFGRVITAGSVAAHLCVKEGRARRLKEGHAAGSAKKSSQANFAPNLYRGRGHHNASKSTPA
jgi:hypothetical protein